MPKEERVRVFGDYQVNRELMSLGNIGCKFMHCLPATRGEDVTDEVADSDSSLCWDEAGNRLTAMRGTSGIPDTVSERSSSVRASDRGGKRAA